MRETEKNLDQSLNDLLQTAAVPAAGDAAVAEALGRFDPCELWHRIRDEYEVVVGILETVGKWLPWAGRLARVLRLVQEILNRLCP
ncbi:MAG TPA: hypothetical protein VHM02_12465 [Thermoanaerobaculia bacterium]|nr:hypothetical protein [Thermoanaerobaculia bacterium]